MSNETLVQLFMDIAETVKHGGTISLKNGSGISNFDMSGLKNGGDRQVDVNLQDLLDELADSFKDLDKQYKDIKDKLEDPTNNDEDGAGGGYFDKYDSDVTTEDDTDEVINKLSDEQKALKGKLDRLGKALAKQATISKVGKEQYHLMAMQFNAMVNYCNILTERINLLGYDRDNGIDIY